MENTRNGQIPRACVSPTAAAWRHLAEREPARKNAKARCKSVSASLPCFHFCETNASCSRNTNSSRLSLSLQVAPMPSP